MAEAPTTMNKISGFGKKLYTGYDATKGFLKKQTVDGAGNTVKGITSVASGLKQGVTGIGKLAIGTPYAIAAAPVYLSAKIASAAESKMDTTMFDSLKEKISEIDNVPSFYKIVFLICFYIFFYSVFYDMGKFFGFSTTELILYMSWFGILLLFVSFIRSTRSRLYN